MSSPLPDVEVLTRDERLDLLERIWDSLCAEPDNVDVPEWHLEVIRERTQALDAGEMQTLPWAEVLDELKARYE